MDEITGLKEALAEYIEWFGKRETRTDELLEVSQLRQVQNERQMDLQPIQEKIDLLKLPESKGALYDEQKAELYKLREQKQFYINYQKELQDRIDSRFIDVYDKIWLHQK